MSKHPHQSDVEADRLVNGHRPAAKIPPVKPTPATPPTLTGGAAPLKMDMSGEGHVQWDITKVPGGTVLTGECYDDQAKPGDGPSKDCD